MEPFRPDRLGKANRVPGSIDIDSVLGGRIRLQVVNSRQVKDVIDFPFQFLAPGGRNTQEGLGQITGNRDDFLRCRSPTQLQFFQLFHRALADQDINLAAAFEQQIDEIVADKTGSARHEITHRNSLQNDALTP